MNNNLHPFGLIFNIKNENCLKEFLGNKNGRGIVYIDLVNSKKFSFKSLSDEARKMCEPGNNVGGSSQISEAFSYELFARWGITEIEKVSRVWPFVYCNMFSWVTCLKIDLLLKLLLFFTPSESLTRDTGKICQLIIETINLSWSIPHLSFKILVLLIAWRVKFLNNKKVNIICHEIW